MKTRIHSFELVCAEHAVQWAAAKAKYPNDANRRDTEELILNFMSLLDNGVWDCYSKYAISNGTTRKHFKNNPCAVEVFETFMSFATNEGERDEACNAILKADERYEEMCRRFKAEYNFDFRAPCEGAKEPELV